MNPLIPTCATLSALSAILIRGASDTTFTGVLGFSLGGYGAGAIVAREDSILPSIALDRIARQSNYGVIQVMNTRQNIIYLRYLI